MADISDGFILEWDIIKADRWLEMVIAQSKYSAAEHYQPVIVEVRFQYVSLTN